MSAFDISALTARIARPRWRRFRAEAIAGKHGQDLAHPRWWKRFEYPIVGTLCAVAAIGMPTGWLILEGFTPLGFGFAALWGAACILIGLFVVVWCRDDYWGPRARDRCRLTEFAHANELAYQPDPAVRRPAAHIFSSAPRRHHRDEIRVPGSHGFVIANYEEIWPDAGETGSFEAGYVVFTLREAYPHTLLTHRRRNAPRVLRAAEPVEGPGGLLMICKKPNHPPLKRLLATGVVELAGRIHRSLEIEIVGSELFLLLAGGRFPLRSPRLWRRLEGVMQALAPFLPSPTGGNEIRALESKKGLGENAS